MNPSARRLLSPAAATIIVAGTAAVSLLHLRETGAERLWVGLQERGDPCLVAEVRLEAAHRLYRPLAAQAREASGGAQLGETSLGVLAGDPALEEAKALLEAAATQCPTMEGPHGLLADIAWWEGRRADAFHHLGLEAEIDGDDGLALANHLAALEIDPNRGEFVIAAAGVALDRGEFDRSSVLLARLGPDDASSPGARLLMAKTEIGLGDMESGYRMVTELLAESPSLREAQGMALETAARLGVAGEGADLVWSYLSEDPTATAQMTHRVGLRFLEAEMNEEALGALEKAESLAPFSVDVLFSLAEAQWRTGSEREARTTLERASSINARRVAQLSEASGFPPQDE